MLMWDKPQMVEGVTVYGDDRSSNTFYVFPNTPRYRMDEHGNPAFRYMKYRNPRDPDRPGGKKGGGFCIFDVEFVVPDEMPLTQAAAQV